MSAAFDALTTHDLGTLADTFREGAEDWRFGKPDSRDLVTMVTDSVGITLPEGALEPLADLMYEASNRHSFTEREYVVAVLAYVVGLGREWGES